MLDAELRLASEGLFAEPSSAITVAALSAFKESRADGISGCVVCLMTSTGLKDMAALSVLGKMPPTFVDDFSILPEYLAATYGLHVN
jgi:threonine synthase